MSNDSTALATVPQTAALSTVGEEFNVAGRMAKALAGSSLVPAAYQNNPSNVMVAIEYANRLGASVLAVMQNLDIIHGNPSLRSKFLIGTVNASGLFSPLRFEFEGTEGKDDWGCRAVAKSRVDGERCVGPLVTIGLAKAEGWYSKSGSKWKTIPELMLHYRAAAWWTRIYCPELSLGLHTTDEIEDMRGQAVSSHAATVMAALRSPDAQLERDAGVQEPEEIPEGTAEEVTPEQEAELQELGL